MVKFAALIHKDTGTVIKYEDWLEMHYSHSTIEIIKRCYDSDRMLFGSDFEIIYDSEFTLEELRDIFRGRQKSDNELMKKMGKDINDKEFIKSKYGIEV